MLIISVVCFGYARVFPANTKYVQKNCLTVHQLKKNRDTTHKFNNRMVQKSDVIADGEVREPIDLAPPNCDRFNR